MSSRRDDDLQGKLMDLAHEMWNMSVTPCGRLGVTAIDLNGGGTMTVTYRDHYLDEMPMQRRGNGKPYTIEVLRRNVWLPKVNGIDLPYQNDPRSALTVALEEFYA